MDKELLRSGKGYREKGKTLMEVRKAQIFFESGRKKNIEKKLRDRFIRKKVFFIWQIFRWETKKIKYV